MANQSQGESKRPSRRQERANRILDTAAALILRWGYNKTTIDDIARQAGVAKGTIYLHWKTREELFNALMKREAVEVLEELKQRITADPAGSTLRGMLKHSALAIMKHPLMKAALLGDTDVIGKLAQSEQNRGLVAEKLAGFKIYLEFMREHGLVRTDLSLQEQLYMLSAIFIGFFLTAPVMPNGPKLSDEEIADLMAETVHRALEPSRPVSHDELQAASQAFIQYLTRFTAFVREQLQLELES